jgi:hypothetical protein
MSAFEELPVVREGVWLYADVTPVRVRIVGSPETLGTGDYEDEEEVSENQPIPCFFVLYEAAGSPRRFSNVTPNFGSVEAAIAHVEQRFPGIKWV